MKTRTFAVKARTILPMSGEKPARGAQLFSPLASLDNGMLLIHDGRILSRGKAHSMRLPVGCPVEDLGNVCLIPGTVNAHAHLDLSVLARSTTLGQGFTVWLSSLIPLLPRGETIGQNVFDAIHSACEELHACGTLHVGNIAGSVKNVLSYLDGEASAQGLSMSHFCEWLGFGRDDRTSLWPDNVLQDLTDNSDLRARASPAGHALYSTDPRILSASVRLCRKEQRIFSLHLAESPEETEMLTTGTGPLYELYRKTILPRDWSAPRLRPLAYALKLSLLGPGSLAVHCVQLDPQEISVLAVSGTAVCLCPRSNHAINVGLPDIHSCISSRLLLCLGTDGLTSNTDLDVRNEAIFLREHLDTPREALIRMLTVNGAAALNLEKGAGHLDPGSPARFAVLPAELQF